MRLLLWRIFSLYNGLLYLEAQLILQYDIEAGRFGAAVLARPVWRRRFGAGPFWRTAVLAQDVLAQIYTDKYTVYGSWHYENILA